uniref:cobalamin biosynthesis protein n=1 Tax=Streptomyces spongiicola TaxID=1690221 RepID=UPI0026D73ECF
MGRAGIAAGGPGASLGRAVASRSTGLSGRFVVGVGARRGAPVEEVLALVRDALREAGAAASSVVALATVAAKAREPGVAAAAAALGVPVRSYPAAELARVPVPNPSAAAAAVGTGSVAEAAALAEGGELVVGKRKSGGQGRPGAVTCAIVRIADPSAPEPIPPRVEPVAPDDPDSVPDIVPEVVPDGEGGADSADGEVSGDSAGGADGAALPDSAERLGSRRLPHVLFGGVPAERAGTQHEGRAAAHPGSSVRRADVTGAADEPSDRVVDRYRQAAASPVRARAGRP